MAWPWYCGARGTLPRWVTSHLRTSAAQGRPFYSSDVSAPASLVIVNYSPLLNSTLAHDLSEACRANQVDQLEKLLLTGARTDAPNHVRVLTQERCSCHSRLGQLGQYPIHTAAGAKACGCLQLLIRHGADIHAKFGRVSHACRPA